MMKKEPNIAIIILNWNGLKDTVECLKSLSKINYDNYKVVVVDNGSDNDEGNKIKELFPDIHLIQNKTNKGFTGGNNDGIKWAKENGFEYIWLLNNDTIVDKDSLSYQISHFKDPDVGAVGSKIKIFGTDLLWSKGVYFLHFSLFPPEIKFFSNIDERKKDIAHESAKEIKYISACSLLMRSDIRESFFDEDFFPIYYEDMELCHRIRKQGFKLIYEPRSVIYHKVARSSGMEKFNKITIYHNFRNKIIFLSKAYPRYMLILIAPLYFVYMIRELLRIALKSREKSEFFKALFRGFFDGIDYVLHGKKA